MSSSIVIPRDTRIFLSESKLNSRLFHIVVRTKSGAGGALIASIGRKRKRKNVGPKWSLRWRFCKLPGPDVEKKFEIPFTKLRCCSVSFSEE
jgi:hypothetical protein